MFLPSKTDSPLFTQFTSSLSVSSGYSSRFLSLSQEEAFAESCTSVCGSVACVGVFFVLPFLFSECDVKKKKARETVEFCVRTCLICCRRGKWGSGGPSLATKSVSHALALQPLPALAAPFCVQDAFFPPFFSFSFAIVLLHSTAAGAEETTTGPFTFSSPLLIPF